MPNLSFLRSKSGRVLPVIFLLLLLAVLAGCSRTSPYIIDIRYESTKTPVPADVAMKNRIMAVANFNDVRKIDDTKKVGYVLKPDGKQVLVFPDKVIAADAVTVGVRDFFYRSGYTVAGPHPAWDLKEATIGDGWGDVVIGGDINKLQVVCDDSQTLSPVRTYTAVVNLEIVVANGKTKKILYKTSAEGSSSLKDVSSSVDKLQSQLNGALTDVIERLFTSGEFRDELKKIAATP